MKIMRTFVLRSNLQLLKQMFTLNCKGKILSLEKPVVMGIVNVSPDSFYKSFGNDLAIAGAVENMLEQGASIIDIGGQSTRPASVLISEEEESARIIKVIRILNAKFPGTIFSIDTFYASVARAAVDEGARMINDVSAGMMDKEMISAVASLKVPYVCMHMKGTPQNMQDAPVYQDLIKEVLEFLMARVKVCTDAGIRDIIIDPGFGFGKTTKHNYNLLKNLRVFEILGKPLLAGISRKGMIYRPLGIHAEEALNGTSVLNTMALLNHAKILRVHDVKEAMEAIKLYNLYQEA